MSEKKKPPTLEELKQNAIDSNKKMNWYSDLHLRKSSCDFEQKLNNSFRILRRNSIFFTRNSYDTMSIITDKNLLSDYKSLSMENSIPNYGITASCVQDFTHALASIITDPGRFSLYSQNYFSKNFDGKNLKANYDHSDFYIFTHCTFPAIYGYFTIPDIKKNAISFIKSFFFNNNYEFASHLISAFFESTPNFLDKLFTLYDEKKFLEDKNKSSMKYFNFFIESLEVAVSFLSISHFELIQSVLAVGNKFFVDVFIKKLFLPQVQLRNSKDILIQIFNFIIANENSAPLLALCRILSTPNYYMKEEIEISGGFLGIEVSNFPVYVSGYEVKMILCINELINKAPIHKKIFKSCEEAFKKFISYPMKVYPPFSQMYKRQNTKYSIFPPFKRAVFKRVNEENLRYFNSIYKFARENQIDSIKFFVPELVDPSSASKINQVVSKMNNGNQENFYKFAFYEISNINAEFASHFDKCMSFDFCIDFFNRIILSCNSLFECQISRFKFDKNTNLNDDFGFRRKLSRYKYDELPPFSDLTEYFRLAFCHISEKNQEMLDRIRSAISLRNDVKSIANNILDSTKCYAIRRIPTYINQLYELAIAISGDDKENIIEIDQCFFMILFSFFDNWKGFFETFCVFFSVFVSKISQNSLFAQNFLKSWCYVRRCFKNAVYEESPFVEEYINNLRNL